MIPHRALIAALVLTVTAAGCRSAGSVVVRSTDLERVSFRQKFERAQQLSHYFSRTATIIDAVNDVTLEKDTVSEAREALWEIDDVDAAGLVTDLYIRTLSHNIREAGDTAELPGMFDETTVKWDWIGKAYYGSLLEGEERDDIALAIDLPNVSPLGEHFLPRDPLGVGETEIRPDLWRVTRLLDELPTTGVTLAKPWTTEYLRNREDGEERYADLRVTAAVTVPMPRDPLSAMTLELSFKVVWDLRRSLMVSSEGRMIGRGEARVPTERGLQRIVTDVVADFVWQTSPAPAGSVVRPSRAASDAPVTPDPAVPQ